MDLVRKLTSYPSSIPGLSLDLSLLICAHQLNKTEILPDAVCRTLLSATTHITSTYPGFANQNEALLRNPEPEMISTMDWRSP